MPTESITDCSQNCRLSNLLFKQELGKWDFLSCLQVRERHLEGENSSQLCNTDSAVAVEVMGPYGTEHQVSRDKP